MNQKIHKAIRWACLAIAVTPQRNVVFLLVLFSVTFGPQSVSAEEWQRKLDRALKNGGAIAVDSAGRTLYSHRADDRFVPASTIKLATSAAALALLGEHYRFPTEFSLTPEGFLAVRGFGDPALTSEELALIARALRTKISKASGIVLDGSYFSPDVVVDGASNSTNPYDAVNGALIANFNTVYFRKLKGGKVTSAEPQTPLTPIAAALGARYSLGEHRVNLGREKDRGIRYVGELLIAFLEREGIKIEHDIRLATIPAGSKPLYVHHSSRQLAEHVRGLLDFSTNFSANQLFLLLGAQKNSEPATVAKAQSVLRAYLEEQVGWKQFSVVEGAGLSHRNSVTPRQMVDLLGVFRPHRDLLPLEAEIFHAKTGSLRGVNTLAGYMTVPGRGEVRFAILINDTVPFDYKFQMARQLYDALSAGRT